MIDRAFFHRDVLAVAPDLVGKLLVRTLPGGRVLRLRITETEAYAGEGDTACHASRGRGRRSEMLYHDGGTIFVYLCYGMYWMLNIVTGRADEPQGVLLRGAEGYDGPGKLTRALGIDGALNGGDILACPGLRIEDDGKLAGILAGKRIGIGYAAEADQARLWRFTLKGTDNG